MNRINKPSLRGQSPKQYILPDCFAAGGSSQCKLSESGFTGLKDWKDKSSQGVAVGLGYGRLSISLNF
jgi:hypothetical protein